MLVFLQDKRMLVVVISPGFYVCFRCRIVVLQAVKKLLVTSLFRRLSITSVPSLITETVLPSDHVRRYHCHRCDADQRMVCVFQKLVVMTIISYPRMTVSFATLSR